MMLTDHILIADIVGSIGVALLLATFSLNVTGRIKLDGLAYASMNALGAGLAALASWMIDYMPFVILEGAWCLVSLAVIVRWSGKTVR